MPPLYMRWPMRFCLPAASLLLGAALPLAAAAQGVSLQGMLGGKALLVVGKAAPRAVAPGETHQGVKVLATRGDEAVVEVDGQRRTLRVGETPVSVGGPTSAAGGRQVVLLADSRGHFITRGYIGNRPVQFMVDTGASVVALSQAEAERLKLDYRQGRPVAMTTANGTAQGWLLKLHSVRLGDMTVYGVDAVITPAPMPTVLLGNSFLNRFSMQREGNRMTLTRH